MGIVSGPGSDGSGRRDDRVCALGARLRCQGLPRPRGQLAHCTLAWEKSKVYF